MRFLRRISGVQVPPLRPINMKTRSPCGCGFSLYSCGFAGFLHQK
nr:MAG TPA: Hepatitis C virus core protein [Caudoviricetes sp.]